MRVTRPLHRLIDFVEWVAWRLDVVAMGLLYSKCNRSADVIMWIYDRMCGVSCKLCSWTYRLEDWIYRKRS